MAFEAAAARVLGAVGVTQDVRVTENGARAFFFSQPALR